MSPLPIEPLKSTFLARLAEKDLIVEAETGSGKSTCLPIWASEKGRVLVIEPRRIACTSLASYLAQQRGEQVGQFVGYAIKLEAHFDAKTQVVFVTPGVALRWYAENQLADFDIVIVDEFHERRWDTDLLVALLKAAPKQRLVLTSATLEGDKLASYLNAERLYAEGRHYHVTIEHRAKESRQLPESRDLDERIAAVVFAALTSVNGDILVFLPGRKEIQQCMARLSHLEDLLVVPLHASVSDKQREQALNPQAIRKVVLATNVAETSLTIPNIGLVIDSGLERRTEQRNGRTTLSLKHISQASAKQRAGRAGRVMDGRCIRLYGQHAALMAVTPPELHREALTEAMLAAASCGQSLTTLEFLEPLPEKSVASAQQLLLNMAAITPEGLATEHGQKIYPLPIDAMLADLVTRMPSKALKEVMIDYSAVLATPGKLYRIANDEEKLEQLSKQETKGCDGQLAVGLLRGKQFSGVTVDDEVLNEARALAEQMREVFELPQLEVASRYDYQQWVNAIATLHPELVFVRRLKRKEALSNGQLEVMIGRESRFNDKEEAALVLNTHSVPGRGVKQTLTLATEMMPLELAVIQDLGLGEWQQGETLTQDDATLVEMHLLYAGRVIATRQQKAEGELALQPMLEAVKNEQRLAGLFKLRKAEIEHWKIFVELGLADQTEHGGVTFDTWFTEQLTLLELNDLDELELFSPDDFPFEGIPYWQYADFAEQYPFTLNLGDLNVSVEYFAKRKLIQVIYTDGLRKTDPKRWELPRWSGWKIQYKKASRIVDIK